MNAAARTIHQCHFFNGQLVKMKLSLKECINTIVLIAILISALGIIYTTNLCRITLSQIDLLDQQTNQLELQWGQLLLEQASRAGPSLIEKRAIETLGMHLPQDKKTLILNK